MVPTDQERAAASRWVQGWLEPEGRRPEPPFSFRYGDRPSGELLRGWRLSQESRQLDDARTQTTLTYVDPQSGLEVRLEMVAYGDYPAVEWVVHFGNRGESDTPILEEVRALDLKALFGGPGERVLHYAVGSPTRVDDFAPLERRLEAGEPLEVASHWGRSSFEYLPFFNLDAGAEGLVIAVGWSGQWTAQFERGAEGGVAVRAGMDHTHLTLHPGEEIRTPRILLVFWREQRLRGHNLLRSLILAHHTPQPEGKQLVAPITWGNWGGKPVAKQIANAQAMARHDLPVECYWIDAEWFGEGEWLGNAGNWYPNETFYPKGLGELGEAVHGLGMEFLVWFEPERVHEGTWLAREHPEWVVGDGEQRMFHLGDPEARDWLTDFLSEQIRQGKIDMLRLDSNCIDLAAFWREMDGPDREGMAQIRHVEGTYGMWDALLERHPGLVIDNCASGGRRIDLESIGRSIPLWRSDYQCAQGFDPIGSQCETYGLSFWVPLSTCGIQREGDTYSFRSGMGSGVCINWRDPDEQFPYEWAREMLEQERRCRPYFYGDYYPLTPYSTASDAWLAYQFHREDLGGGVALAFRRQECAEASVSLRLQGLREAASYEVELPDTGESRRATGAELAEGLQVEVAEAPGAALVIYREE